MALGSVVWFEIDPLGLKKKIQNKRTERESEAQFTTKEKGPCECDCEWMGKDESEALR